VRAREVLESEGASVQVVDTGKMCGCRSWDKEPVLVNRGCTRKEARRNWLLRIMSKERLIMVQNGWLLAFHLLVLNQSALEVTLPSSSILLSSRPRSTAGNDKELRLLLHQKRH
jgi:hypothetical protein